MSNKIYVTYDQIEDISCNRCEQETAINWLRDDDIAIVCTSDFTMVTKLSKAMAKDPDNYKCYYYECNRDKETGRLGNYFFEVPKKLIAFRAEREARQMTEEQREIVRERFKKNRKTSGVQITL